VSEVLGLDERDRRRIEADTGRPRLIQSVGRLHLTIEALEPDGDEHDASLHRREIDLLAGPNLVVSVHRGRVLALDRFEDGLHDETSLGALDAGDLLSTIVDEVISGYYRLVESVERRIDRLDQAALMAGPDADILAEIVAVRRRIGQIRRTLAPHRTALAALARPEMRLEETVGQPWPGLIDRLEVALSSVEALRDALLGTYDIHMGKVAQRANDVMKALTVLSAVLLPAVVLAGLMGMNFEHPFFDDEDNLYLVLAAMALFSILLVAVAHWRRWI
jgi:magnesium transporter